MKGTEFFDYYEDKDMEPDIKP